MELPRAPAQVWFLVWRAQGQDAGTGHPQLLQGKMWMLHMSCWGKSASCPGAMSSTGISAAWGSRGSKSNTWLFRAAHPLTPFNGQDLLNPTLPRSTSCHFNRQNLPINMAKFTPFHCKMDVSVFYFYTQLLIQERIQLKKKANQVLPSSSPPLSRQRGQCLHCSAALQS